MGFLDSERSVKRAVWIAVIPMVAVVALAVLGFIETAGHRVVRQPGGQARLLAKGLLVGPVAWSPDSRRLVVMTARSDIFHVLANTVMPLEIIDAQTGRSRPLAVPSLAQTFFPQCWSRTGRIYGEVSPVTGKRRADENQIWAVEAAGGRSWPLTTGNDDSYAGISPDGRLVAFLRSTGQQCFLFVVPAAGGRPARVLAEPIRPNCFHWIAPREILYVSRTERSQGGQVRVERVLRAVDSMTGKARTLVGDRGVQGACVLGRQVVYMSTIKLSPGARVQKTRVNVLDLNTGRIRHVRDLGTIPLPGLSARRGPGQSIVFRSWPVGGDVCKLDLDGHLTRLTNFNDVDDLETSPDGSWMSFVRRGRSSGESLWVMRLGSSRR